MGKFTSGRVIGVLFGFVETTCGSLRKTWRFSFGKFAFCGPRAKWCTPRNFSGDDGSQSNQRCA